MQQTRDPDKDITITNVIRKVVPLRICIRVSVTILWFFAHLCLYSSLTLKLKEFYSCCSFSVFFLLYPSLFPVDFAFVSCPLLIHLLICESCLLYVEVWKLSHGLNSR